MNPKILIDPNVHNAVYLPYRKAAHRTQIFYGGSSSGKSVFIAQRAVIDMLSGGRNYLVCRAVGRTMRGSVFTEIKKTITSFGLDKYFTINKSDMVITCINGYQIIFTGLDDVEKIKSITPTKGVITDIWVEEATETSHDTIKQLYKRQRGQDEYNLPKRMILSFNPILQNHWIYQEYFKPSHWSDEQKLFQTDELLILKTTHVDNSFLSAQDHAGLENEKDSYFYNVYSLGNWGVLGNVIFTNWKIEDLSDRKKQFANLRFGLDFGFADDPAALPAAHFDRMRKTIYIYDEFCERGLTNPQLAGLIKPIAGSNIVTCDSAEPKSIQELKDNGINAKPARKGADSVNFGIQWLQQYTIIIDSRCVSTIGEFQQYKWAEDKDGNAIRRPVDRNNHIIDALRYAFEDDARMTKVSIGAQSSNWAGYDEKQEDKWQQRIR